MKNPSVKIYQIYFEPWQSSNLSPVFTPYFNKTRDEFYESGVIKREFESGVYLKHDYTGFVSWRFESKTFISAQEFIDLQIKAPGNDVYFLNPFPELAEKYQNVWHQGAKSHPGLLDLAQRVFTSIGCDIDVTKMKNHSSSLLYCNYWYGSKKFWSEYMEFCKPIYALFSDPSSEFYRDVRSSSYYYSGGTIIPFFMERVFSTFLYLRPDISRGEFDWNPQRKTDLIENMRNQLNLYEYDLGKGHKCRNRYLCLRCLKRMILRKLK